MLRTNLSMLRTNQVCDLEDNNNFGTLSNTEILVELTNAGSKEAPAPVSAFLSTTVIIKNHTYIHTQNISYIRK